jgi:ubiquinone/menaquinone biosynthesis C-methylase UbiE
MRVCLACGGSFHRDSWLCPECGHEPSCVGGYVSFAPELSEANDGFPAGAHEHLFRAEPGHFWFRSRNKIILWALRKHFPDARNFFEIGCGTGFVLLGIRSAFQNIELYGSEIYRQGLQFAERRVPDAMLYQMDASHIPFRDHFDVIGAFDVLEHIEDDQSALTEMFKAVKKESGGIIVTVPQHNSLWSVVDEFSRHFRRYSAPELKAKAERAGFHVLKMSSFMSLTLPLLVAARLRQRNVKVKDFDPLSEFRVPRAINSALEAVLSLEREAIQRGLRWPAGSSLLLVARAR